MQKPSQCQLDNKHTHKMKQTQQTNLQQIPDSAHIHTQSNILSQQQQCNTIRFQKKRDLFEHAESIQFDGDLMKMVGQIVPLSWQISVNSIKHLVGYDVTNYLVQHGSQRYIVKVYRNINQQQLQILHAQNTVLQYLNNQSDHQHRYPVAVQRISRYMQNNNELEKGFQIETDKNIVYDIQKGTIFNNINSNNIMQIQQQPISSIRTINQTNTHKQIQMEHLDMTDKYIKVLRLCGMKQQMVAVRVLQYIQGTMLGTIIQQHQKQHNKQQQYYNLILNTIPKQIAQKLTIPLLKYPQANKDTTRRVHSIYKNRQFEWNIGSFLNNECYYKQRYAMVCNNPNRPAWHHQVIEYFISTYQQCLSALDSTRIRRCMIYNDANQWNIVVGERDTVSFIDMGDIVHSYLIQQISTYALYILYHRPQPTYIRKCLSSIIRAYTAIVPITIQQLALFYISVPVRMCVSLCNSQHAMNTNNNNNNMEYVSMSQVNGWNLLKVLQQMYKIPKQHPQQKFKQQQAYISSISNNHPIFNSDLFHQLRQSANIVQSLHNAGSCCQQDSQYGKHWTTEQQFWNNQQQQDQQQKQHQHVLHLLNKYYSHIIPKHSQPSQIPRVQLKRLPGYIVKNYKLTVCFGSTRQEYVMKVYRNVKILQKYIQIQSKIKQYILDNQHRVNCNGKQIVVKIPRTVEVERVGGDGHNGDSYSYSHSMHDEYWGCKITIRLLTFVQGQSYSTCVQKLQLNRQQLQSITQQQIQKLISRQIQRQQDKLLQMPVILAKLEWLGGILGSMGRMLGKLDVLFTMALQHMCNTAYTKQQLYQILKRRDYQWNLQHTHIWTKHMHYIEDPSIHQIIKTFVTKFNLKYGNNSNNQIRNKLIHFDPNEDNCIISGNNIVDTLIDFDQIQIAYVVDEIVIVLAHTLHPIPKIIAQCNQQGMKQIEMHPTYRYLVEKVVRSYTSMHPLSRSQLQSIYLLLAMRISMCITLQSRDKHQDPENTHIFFDLQILKQYLKDLHYIGEQQFLSAVCLAW